MTFRYRGGTYAITTRGVERDGEPVSLAELRDTAPARSALWAWLREHGHRRPAPSGPSGPGGQTDRVLGGWRVEPSTKRLVAGCAAREGVSESAWVERAILSAAEK